VGAEADDDGLPVSLDELPAAHLRVLLDGLPVFERYGLLLAGGYAFRAHEILHRPSQDLDFATRDDTPLPEIAGHVQNAFQTAGYHVELVEATGRYARLTLRPPGPGEALEMDLMKEALDPSFVTVQVAATASVRALSLEDTVGLKARAWHDRFVIRDIIDLHAVGRTFSYIDLERLR
jgi:Nucleotidyl transferase AbiEii toxin, Type IV TA system